MIYLDANASVPALPEAKRALVEAAEIVGNPSSTHAIGRAARVVLDEARDRVAIALGGASKDVVFTSGASEGNRWLADAIPAGSIVASSSLEHPSLAKNLRAPLSLEEAARADVVFCTAAHNETGIIPGLDDLCARVSSKCIVCVDAAQAVARLPVLPSRVDAIVASAHKIGAFAGSGAVLLRGNARRLLPPWLGGGQEASMRPGTEALALHAAFGAACAVIERTREQHRALASMRDRIEVALVDAWGARALGGVGPRLDNTTALVVSGVDTDALRIALDGAGVAVGFGAACSALVPEPSPSLIALGLSPADARSTVRISLAPGFADVDEAIARLTSVKGVIERSRRRSGV